MITRAAARAVIGGLFVGHGTQKLFGWFGGPGLPGTRQMMNALEMRPPEQHAVTVGVTETAGGALLALGLATPAAVAGLVGVMITAIRKVHWANGPWNSSRGYEYNLVLIAALLSLAESGPGDLSLDHLLGTERAGVGWALGALAAGAAASVAVVEYGRRQGVAEIQRPEPAGADASSVSIDTAVSGE